MLYPQGLVLRFLGNRCSLFCGVTMSVNRGKNFVVFNGKRFNL